MKHPDERTAEEWWDRVEDFGLDDASTSLEDFIMVRLDYLRLEVTKAARWYVESGQDRELRLTLADLDKFETDHAL